LKDSEAKADILSESNTTAQARLFMYPGGF
ncbi:unnamed protein product, partial [marine sediment metagenome]